MKDHYQLTSVAYSSLLNDGVDKVDMFKSIPLFDPNKTEAPISKVGVLYYLDKKGDFNKGPRYPHKKIAKALFEAMNPKDQFEVLSYLDWMEGPDEDEFDEEDEIAKFLASKKGK